MTDQNALYAELKPDLQRIATPLFDFSKQCLLDRDDFLPHGAGLNDQNQVELVGAKGERDVTNAKEILPLLQGGLRALAKQKPFVAVGVAESVTITLPGKTPTRAIKVLFEHRRGLSVALYLPYEKKSPKEYGFGTMLSMHAAPEVKAWG